MFKEEVAKLNIPDGFEVIVEPWPYGGKYSSDLNTIRIFSSDNVQAPMKEKNTAAISKRFVSQEIPAPATPIQISTPIHCH
jgi:hypothetical protein